MSPFSRPVLLPALLLCSPVLVDAYSGATSWSDALNRFLLVLAVWWVAVSVVHAIAFSPSRVTSRDPTDGGSTDEHDPSGPGGAPGHAGDVDSFGGTRPPTT